MVLAAQPVAGHDVTFQTGGRGWVYETFGADVAVLRAPVNPAGSAASRDDEVAWLLSCSGQDRRVRLSFPRPIAEGSESVGSMQLRPVGMIAREDRALVFRFVLADSKTLTIDRTESDAMFAIGRMLERGPPALEILMSFGREPVPFNRVQPYHVVLSFGPSDKAVIAHFLNTCSRARIRRAE